MSSSLKIITIDDKNSAVLRTKAKPIQDNELPLAREIAQKLYEALEPYFPAAGLAAPQIGIDKTVFIYSFDRDPKNLEVVINPSFTPIGETKLEGWEGCLSSVLSKNEWKVANLPRYKTIQVSYLTKEGKKIEKVLEGFPARVFQHEWDHLQGTLNIDRKESLIKSFATEQELDAFMVEVKKRDARL